MRFPWTGRPPMPPAPLVAADSTEARLLRASADADTAAAALLDALARRRSAIAELSSCTDRDGKAPLHNLLAVHSVQGALAAAGDIVRLLGLSHVLVAHKRGYLHQARAAIASSAAFRTTPTADPATDAGGPPGEKEFA